MVEATSNPQPTKVVALDYMALANHTNTRSEWLLVADKVVVEYLRIVAVTECQRASTLVEEIVAKDVATALARDDFALAIALLEEAIFDYALGLLVGHIARSEANATLTIYATTLLVDQRVRASEVAVTHNMAWSLFALGKAHDKNLAKISLIEEGAALNAVLFAP